MLHHPREDMINLDHLTHKYLVKGYPEKYYISTTTWLHTFQVDKFDANAISERLAAKRMTTKAAILNEWDKARDFGTNMHAKIEQWLLNSASGSQIAQEVLQENEAHCMKQFQEFWKTQILVKEYKPEMKIYDEELHIAGCIDLLVKFVDGTYGIYDWKCVASLNTGNQWSVAMKNPFESMLDTNYYHYTLQLNMYKYILERKYNFKVSTMCLIQLHPSIAEYKVWPIDDCQHLIEKATDDSESVVEQVIEEVAEPPSYVYGKLL